MRLVVFIVLLSVTGFASAEAPRSKTQPPTAEDSELATRCARAGSTVIEAAERYPSSKAEREEFIAMVGESLRSQDRFAPQDLEMFSAQFSMETMLKAGLTPVGETRHQMVGHASATCAIVVYKNR